MPSLRAECPNLIRSDPPSWLTVTMHQTKRCMLVFFLSTRAFLSLSLIASSDVLSVHFRPNSWNAFYGCQVLRLDTRARYRLLPANRPRLKCVKPPLSPKEEEALGGLIPPKVPPPSRPRKNGCAICVSSHRTHAVHICIQCIVLLLAEKGH